MLEDDYITKKEYFQKHMHKKSLKFCGVQFKFVFYIRFTFKRFFNENKYHVIYILSSFELFFFELTECFLN